MTLNEKILSTIDASSQEALDLLIQLGKIPAPSHHEERRAEFCKNWLEQQGAKGVYIDEALNVIYPIGCTEDNPVVVFAAHLDVVFPDMDELPMKIENGRIYCPGIGDDTMHVVALLMAAKYIAQNNLVPKDCGILLVANSCEEGLGDLKGVKTLMKKFGTRVKEFVTFDGPDSDRGEFVRRMEPHFLCIDRGNGMMEFVQKGCSKAQGMQCMLQAMGAAKENTFAIGDSTNDVTMFRMAGHAICMGNGMEEAKKEAEFVTDAVLEDGIAKALRHYGLIG